MTIRNASDLTAAVLSEVARAQDPRARELLTLLVKHLHGFVTESRLSEAEFQQALGLLARLGQATHASHNEVALAAGSLGVSALVCLINNGVGGQALTTANLMGPFWRMDSPVTPNGGSIVRGPTPGLPVFVRATVIDADGDAVIGAEVDVWQSSSEGFYENQDPGQVDMNLRGKFHTDDQGQIRFWTIKPSGYPIPVRGPVGELIRTLGRHNMRPAHIHFMVCKPGFKTQFSQVYSDDDPHLQSDVQFGVTEALVGRYVPHDEAPADGPDVEGTWYELTFTFVLQAGVSRLPPPPIRGKAVGERPVLEVLQRRIDASDSGEKAI
jgi:hydroxyquinol 1,2-dioxygenase